MESHTMYDGRNVMGRLRKAGRRPCSAGIHTIAYLVEDGITVDVGLGVRVEEAIEPHRGAACVEVDEHLPTEEGGAHAHRRTPLACVGVCARAERRLVHQKDSEAE
eukprot:5583267-Prymnesium_polylepis.1